MHVISRKKLRDFCQRHGDCYEALDDWYKIASKANWGNLVETQSAIRQPNLTKRPERNISTK